MYAVLSPSIKGAPVCLMLVANQHSVECCIILNQHRNISGWLWVKENEFNDLFIHMNKK